MPLEGVCYYFAQPNRNGVSNQSAYNTELGNLSFIQELVAVRKCLQDRRFPKGDRAVLFWVPKATVAIPKTLRRDGG